MASESSGPTQDHAHTGVGDGGVLGGDTTLVGSSTLNAQMRIQSANFMLAGDGTHPSTIGLGLGVAMAVYR